MSNRDKHTTVGSSAVRPWGTTAPAHTAHDQTQNAPSSPRQTAQAITRTRPSHRTLGPANTAAHGATAGERAWAFQPSAGAHAVSRQ